MKVSSNWFVYNKGKVIQALRYHFISRKEIKLIIIILNVFAVFSAILFYLKKVPPSAFLLSSFLWFVVMIIFWYLLPRMIYKKSKTFKDELRVDFTEETLVLENRRTENSWPWTSLSSWIESPHFFHLYFNPRSFFIIPKEAFSEQEIFEARNFLKRKIGKSV